MADLIAVLIAAICQFLAAGGGSADLDTMLAAEIIKSQPVPIGEAAVDTEGLGNKGIEHFKLDLADVLLDPLEIDELQIAVSDILIQGENKASLSGISFTAKISEGDLTDALRQHTEALADATITVTKQALELSGTYPLWGMRIPYRVAGTVEVQDDSQLVFRVSSSGIGRVNNPAALNQLIEKEINPVYDLDAFAARSKKDIELARDRLDYEFKLKIRSIKLGQGHIIVAGSA